MPTSHDQGYMVSPLFLPPKDTFELIGNHLRNKHQLYKCGANVWVVNVVEHI